nr:recombinase family protein [uncultured Anaeromusa sp.]
MSRTIKTLCWVYASKKEIFKEWISGMAEGSFAVGKRYVKQKEMIKQYGFAISKKGRCCINEIEAETVKDIFMMYFFGVSINDICKKLANYQSKTPNGLSLWSAEIVRDILNDESYTGYQFIFENDTVMVMQVGWSIIPKKIFAVTQEMNTLYDNICNQGNFRQI